MEKIISALFCFVVLFLLLIPISAHPGRTDGSGGHYDRNSGGYHYHHGFPAHAHYDMDGDGDADCPHSIIKDDGSYPDFNYDENATYKIKEDPPTEQKTEHKTEEENETAVTETKETEAETKKADKKLTVKNIFDWIVVIFGIVFFGIPIVLAVLCPMIASIVSWLKNIIKRIKQKKR